MRTRSTPSFDEFIPSKSEEASRENEVQTICLKARRKVSTDKDETAAVDSMSPDYSRAKSIDCDVTNSMDSERATNQEDEVAREREDLLRESGSEKATPTNDATVTSDDEPGTETESSEKNEKRQQSEPKTSTEEGAATFENVEGIDATEKSSENIETLDTQVERYQSSSETDSRRSDLPFLAAMPPISASSTSSSFIGQLQSELAKSFYSSLSLFASQAVSRVKQEPKELGYQGYGTSTSSLTTPSDGHFQNPPRSGSRSSGASGRSFEDRSDFHSRDDSMPQSIRSGMLPLPLSRGMSPNSLAAQLRSNDFASMVVSRQQKFAEREQDSRYPQLPYSHSDGETSPPSFAIGGGASPLPNGFLAPPGSHATPSPSLHHFTTRYTIETPVDPSRLGVELALDHYNDEPVIEVECGGNRGLLYVNKLCQGSKGQSIHFNDEWLTPNEFQFISGRETAKDWKRSIRHCGKSLKTLMTKGILQVHPPVCECSQCKGLHAGSKLLAGKKTPQKDFNNNNFPKRIKSATDFSFSPDGSHSRADEMARHGFDGGGLSSIISQLRKAHGFESNDAPETLDLSSKAQDRNETSSPEASSRKRSRNDSPEPKKLKQEPNGGRTSPAAKRRYSSQADRSHGPMDAASRGFLSPEEQYRHMIALMSRSISPGEQQRQFLSLAQHLADPMEMPPGSFGDFTAFPSSFHPNAANSGRTKSKLKNREIVDDAFDLSRKTDRRQNYDSSARRSGHGFVLAEKYRKPDHRRTPTPSRADQKYIALESRHREDRPGHSPRDDVRSWTASRHAAMIDLNSGGLSHGRVPPDWTPKIPWPPERSQMSGKRPEAKTSPKRNGHNGGYFLDNVALERVPISKTPVTTLHHRPQEGDSRRRHTAENHRASSRRYENDVRTTPMLDLQKHAVPIVSLKRPTLAQSLFHSSEHRSLGKQLSDNSDQEMKDINEDRPSLRQSSSAPPPRLSPHEATREARRPTSAQDRLPFRMTPRPSRNVAAMASSIGPTSSSVGNFMEMAHQESYLQKKNKEVQDALDDMQKWTVDDVCKFVLEVDPKLEDKIEEFRILEIDGEGLPLLTVPHLMNIADIKLGRALKIVSRVRRILKVLPHTIACCSYPAFSPSPKKVTPAANLKSRENISGSPIKGGNEKEKAMPMAGDAENEKA